MENIVELKNLKKSYGLKEAVKGIDLEIRAGELFVFVGPNGAGKTTTLKIMAGLLKPTSGTVMIGGFDMHKEPMKAKMTMSFVPDVPFVYEKLSAWEMLRFIGKLYEMKKDDQRKKGEELLKFFSLWDVRDVLIEEFSHGMRQKAVLAAALMHDPKLIVLDEPMVGLGPVSIRSFKDLLRRKAGGGMAVVFSTLTLSTAEELADRIAIIDHGNIIALGTLGELREKYRSKENLEEMFLKLVEKEGLPLTLPSPPGRGQG